MTANVLQIIIGVKTIGSYCIAHFLKKGIFWYVTCNVLCEQFFL